MLVEWHGLAGLCLGSIASAKYVPMMHRARAAPFGMCSCDGPGDTLAC